MLHPKVELKLEFNLFDVVPHERHEKLKKFLKKLGRVDICVLCIMRGCPHLPYPIHNGQK